MAKKKPLGRGLGALITEAKYENKTTQKVSSIEEIDVRLIESNPYQPRKEFQDEGLKELSESIKTLGLIQPITVHKLEADRYQLIAGERRLKACKRVGKKNIIAYVRDTEDKDLLELALVENIQRVDLNAIEIALSYNHLIEEKNITQEDLSERIGKKRSTISNYIRLLKLPAQIQLGIRDKKIQMGHARSLVNVEDAELQMKIYDETIKNALSVRKVEELVKLALHEENETNEEVEATNDDVLPEQYNQLIDKLSFSFDTKVKVNRNKNGKGSIVIPFASDEELEKISTIFNKI